MFNEQFFFRLYDKDYDRSLKSVSCQMSSQGPKADLFMTVLTIFSYQILLLAAADEI